MSTSPSAGSRTGGVEEHHPNKHNRSVSVSGSGCQQSGCFASAVSMKLLLLGFYYEGGRKGGEGGREGGGGWGVELSLPLPRHL